MPARSTAGRAVPRRALGIACGLVLALIPAVPAAGGQPDSFFGNCRFAGYAVTDPAQHSFSVRFAGTCSGLLNGSAIVEAPVRISARGTSTDVEEVPVLAAGEGVATVRPTAGPPASIRFGLQRLGLVEHVTGTCGGNSLVAVTPTSAPEDGRLTITGTMQTVAPLCG